MNPREKRIKRLEAQLRESPPYPMATIRRVIELHNVRVFEKRPWTEEERQFFEAHYEKAFDWYDWPPYWWSEDEESEENKGPPI
jgi:hypothetical protein